MHSIKEIDMLAAKMDLLAKRVEHYEKVSAQETLKAMDSHMTYEVCGDVGHSGNACPKTQEDHNFVNTDNGFCPQHQGWNQRSNNQGAHPPPTHSSRRQARVSPRKNSRTLSPDLHHRCVAEGAVAVVAAVLAAAAAVPTYAAATPTAAAVLATAAAVLDAAAAAVLAEREAVPDAQRSALPSPLPHLRCSTCSWTPWLAFERAFGSSSTCLDQLHMDKTWIDDNASPGAPSGGADIHLPPRRLAPTPNSSRTSKDLLVAPPLRHYPGFACLFMWCFHGRTLDVIAMSCDKDTTRGFGPLVPWHLKVDFQAINGLKNPLKTASVVMIIAQILFSLPHASLCSLAMDLTLKNIPMKLFKEEQELALRSVLMMLLSPS
ncbi:uncharacterized protein [Miscanthus floridulus]|uniref:uncharacterized protein n=1 Tax=Miscanthus floridulus TaxID=154761 RepID=UPI0034590B6E